MKFLTILAALIVTTTSVFAEWTQLAPLPVSEGYSSSNTIVYDGGDYIYATAGYVWLGGTNFRVSPEFFRYSIPTNTWDRMADAPGPMEHNIATFVHDGSIYMNRGNFANEFYQYDIANNSWTTRGWAPGPYGAGTSGNDQMYYTGGMFDQQKLYHLSRSGGGFDWQVLANNPTDMAYNSMAYDAGKLYLTVGKTDWTNDSNQFYAFDLGTSLWQRLADIPVATHGHGLVSVGNGKFLLNTGLNSTDQLGLYQYDALSDTWSRLRDTPSIFNYGRGVYDGSRFSYWVEGGTTAFYRYDPVPEPTTIAILGIGLLAAIKKRRRSKQE